MARLQGFEKEGGKAANKSDIETKKEKRQGNTTAYEEKPMTTPLTGPYSEIRRDRAQRDPEFRRLMLIRAIKYLNENDLVMGKSTLYDYIEDTVGFSKLASALKISSVNLENMLNGKVNPSVDDMFAIIQYLKKEEGIEVKVTFKQVKSALKTKPAQKARVKSTRKTTRKTISGERAYA